ncbi:hypothetical protein VKT23_011741 [Stygiomarasmius scandens]|uniref:Uncharacterized protein n=1 Tax=Marasmiellus scandens TaxID=2682957 RepID=A0ABR1JBA1_9AGAR
MALVLLCFFRRRRRNQARHLNFDTFSPRSFSEKDIEADSTRPFARSNLTSLSTDPISRQSQLTNSEKLHSGRFSDLFASTDTIKRTATFRQAGDISGASSETLRRLSTERPPSSIAPSVISTGSERDARLMRAKSTSSFSTLASVAEDPFADPPELGRGGSVKSNRSSVATVKNPFADPVVEVEEPKTPTQAHIR